MRQVKFKNLKKEVGFTFIELLIVVAIVAILSALVIAGFREGNRESNLRFASQNLVSVFKQAQIMASSGKIPAGESDPPPGGYGVYIDSLTSYILFADKDDSGDYDVGEEVEDISLPNNIEFFEGGAPPNPVIGLNVLFASPDGKMSIYLGSELADRTIVLRVSPSGGLIQIYLNSTTGLIEASQ